MLRPTLEHLIRLIDNTWQTIKLAWEISSRTFIVLIMIELIMGTLPIATAWLTKILFDLLAEHLQEQMNPWPTNIVPLLFTLTILLILGDFLNSKHYYLNAELGRKISLQIRIRVYEKINSFSTICLLENPEFHDSVRIAAQEGQHRPIQVLGIFSASIRSFVTLVSFLSILITFNLSLTILIIASILPQLYVQLKIGTQRFNLTHHNNPKERRSAYYGDILSGVQFAKELRLFNSASYFLQIFKTICQEINEAQRSQQMREVRWQIRFAFISNLIASGVFIFVVLQTFNGHLTFGDISLYSSAVTSLQASLLTIINNVSRLNENALYFSHFKSLMELPKSTPSSSSTKISSLHFGIELKNISFRYSEEQPWILRHLNLLIPANSTLALVGLNGAGKSTIVKLLLGLYKPNEGEILWDGIDIKNFEPQELRARISAIFQNFMRYDLTVQENIGVGNIKYIENVDYIQQVAQRVGIHNTIDQLPDGYQTLLSRWITGNLSRTNLSGGEWQKLALARMLMNSADLLILDEPTANLDAQAEYELYSHFAELVTKQTSLLITHKFSTIRMANVIAVLHDGQIIEYGSHATLLSAQGTYAKLYAMQAEKHQPPFNC